MLEIIESPTLWTLTRYKDYVGKSPYLAVHKSERGIAIYKADYIEGEFDNYIIVDRDNDGSLVISLCETLERSKKDFITIYKIGHKKLEGNIVLVNMDKSMRQSREGDLEKVFKIYNYKPEREKE